MYISRPWTKYAPVKMNRIHNRNLDCTRYQNYIAIPLRYCSTKPLPGNLGTQSNSLDFTYSQYCISNFQRNVESERKRDGKQYMDRYRKTDNGKTIRDGGSVLTQFDLCWKAENFTDCSQGLRLSYAQFIPTHSEERSVYNWVDLEAYDQTRSIATMFFICEDYSRIHLLSYLGSLIRDLILLSKNLSSEIFIWDTQQWEDLNSSCRVRWRSVVAKIEALHWVESVDGVRLQSGQLSTAQSLRVNAARCQQRLVGINGSVVDRWRHAHVIRHAAAVVCQNNKV